MKKKPTFAAMYFRPPRLLRKLFPSLIWSIPDAENAVFLTFDDGPCPEVTPWVLDLLDQYGAKATFFCLGKNAEMHPELFREILRRGHAVGNHSYSHVKGWGRRSGSYVRDVDTANDILQTNLFRPPYARISTAQARVLSERYKIIMWNVLSRDYVRSLGGPGCERNVTPHLREGAIVVFHDSVKTFPNLRYALPRVLEALREKGLEAKRIEL